MAFIRITLKSDLCAGSGEATGVSVDKDLCISQSGLPYIPARRIKGCLREAAKQLQNYDCPEATNPNIDALFGTDTGIEGCLDLRNAMLPGADAMERWLQSSVPKQLKSAATPLNVARLFTYIRGQTRLKDGVAVKGSLRYTRVLDRYNALEPGQETFLDATVSLRKSEQTTNTKELAILLEKCCKALRHLGSMRNRGLGEIRTELLEKETLISNPSEQPLPHENTNEGKLDTIIRYQVVLNAPVTLPGCAEDLLAIPARSVIGCTANTYLQTGKAEDPLFRRLFLDGTVRWSSLTPVTGGLRTVPTPLMLVRLSNEKRYFNLYSAASAFGKKTKALEGTYAVQTENGFRIPAVKTHTVYHHSTGADGTLYMQRSLDAGMIYGGEVYLPAALAKTVESLLQQTNFAFGRSRSAQYATCTLLDAPTSTPKSDEKCETQTGETVYAVLQADLLLSEQGLYEIRNERVRAALAEAFDLDNSPEIAQMDYCFHHSIGGYQTTWQLQKPQVPAVRGGSVYVFRAKGGTVSREKALGELLQEGFGLVRIYTEREMHLLTEIEDAMVDMESVEEASAERCAQLYTALLAAAVREAVRDSVIKLHQKDHVTKDLKKGTIGRLRLMLSEAETYNALLKNVETMKESDKHSQNTTSAKESVKALLKKVYGQKPPSFDALLRRTTEGQRLLDLLQHNERAKERLLETWKEPLDMLLHLAHYEKAKEGQ